jgi:alkylhydroperoxidase family enzyme
VSYLTYTQQFDDNLLAFLVSDHERYRPIVEFFDTMTKDLNELSWAEAELIASEISKTNQSNFCTGIRAGMINALDAAPADLVNDKFEAALNFALKLNQAPNSVTQDDVEEVLNAGWTEKTVEDIVGLVAIQQLYNTIGIGLGFNNFSALAFEQIGRDTVNKGGYLASFQSFIASSSP